MNKPIVSDTKSVRHFAALFIRAGERLFSMRIIVGAIGVCIGAFLIRPRNLFGEYEMEGAAVSLVMVLAGLALRAWAASCAGFHTRSGQIEAPQLVTGGPYAHVRNPIYLGSFILGLGMVGLLGDPLLLIPDLLVFAVFFWMIIPAEEKFLEREFGEEFRHFRGAVPQLVPTLRPWKGATRPRMCWRAARGEAVVAAALFAIYFGFSGLRWLQAVR